eukprot:PRCOL_00001069-RA
MVGRRCKNLSARFHCAYGFATHRLAYMLDSLVRVSRRAVWEPCASILQELASVEGAPAPWPGPENRSAPMAPKRFPPNNFKYF